MKALKLTLVLFFVIVTAAGALLFASASDSPAPAFPAATFDIYFIDTDADDLVPEPTAAPEPTPVPTPAESPTPVPLAAETTPDPTEEPGTPAWIIGIYVNLREGPGTNTDIIGTYDYGTALRILEKSGNWAHIMIQGQEGWMTLNLISTERPDDVEDEAGNAPKPAATRKPSSNTHTHSWTTETVHHDEVSRTTNHPAVYETVHHDAVYETQEVWIVDVPASDETPEEGHYESQEVCVSEAWDEEKLVTPAWRETVIEKLAWDETYEVCSTCGQTR